MSGLAPPPPPTGSTITVYTWMTAPVTITGPCAACMQLAMQKSLVRRPAPHPFCVCIGDVPSPVACTFQGREILHESSEEHLEPLMEMPPGSTREFSVSGETSFGGQVEGEGVSVNGSVTEGQTHKITVTNDNEFAIQLLQIWINVTVSWIDTISCSLFGFDITQRVPGNLTETRDGGIRVIPVS